MKIRVDRRKCDGCGKQVEREEAQYGGNPLSGWLVIERTDGSTAMPRKDTGPWDFCGTECAVVFLTALPRT